MNILYVYKLFFSCVNKMSWGRPLAKRSDDAFTRAKFAKLFRGIQGLAHVVDQQVNL